MTPSSRRPEDCSRDRQVSSKAFCAAEKVLLLDNAFHAKIGIEGKHPQRDDR